MHRIKDGGLRRQMAAHTSATHLPAERKQRQTLFNPDGSVSDYGRLLIHDPVTLAKQNARRRLHSQSSSAQEKSKLDHNGDRNFSPTSRADVRAGKPFRS